MKKGKKYEQMEKVLKSRSEKVSYKLKSRSEKFSRIWKLGVNS